jgi:hypothetical protein
MGFSRTINLNGARGRIGTIFELEPITFKQLFTGTPQYYAGSIIQVQEVVQVITSIYDEKLVDVDYGWWQPHQYRGTWQLTNGISASGRNDDHGFIWTETCEISRYSTYTITANPNTAIGVGEGSVILDCNFYTVPEVYLFPGTSTPVPGFRLRPNPRNKPIFRGYQSITPAPLADTDFFRRITDVGIYLKPGVQGNIATYNAAIINDVYTDYSAFPVSTCELAEPSCEEQFAAAIEQLGGFKDGIPSNQLGYQSYYFSTLAAANAIGGYYAPEEIVLECPTDPTQTKTIWRAFNGY